MNPEKHERYAEIVENEPLLTQNGIKQLADELEYDEDEAVVFYSSGDEPKRIPFSLKDQERFAQALAETFHTIGMAEDDIVLNLGAPAESHHQSGWGIAHGSKALGATPINRDVTDFTSEDVRERWDDITVAVSLPRMMHSIGEQVQEQYGDLQDLFPNAELAVTSGDTLPQRLRDTLADQWGFDEVRNFYAATEMGAVAAEDGQDDMVLTNNNLYIELLDPDADIDSETNKVSEDAITSIYDVNEPTTGAALFSAPDRTLLPYIRYRAGDVLTAYPADDGPRIRFEGREDRVINLSGAMVYPREIENAIGAYGAEDGSAVLSVEDDYAVLNMYLEGSADEDIVPYLAEENETIDTWYDSGAIKIRQQGYTSEEELAEHLDQYDLDVDLLDAELKQPSVTFDKSYQELFGSGRG